MRVNVNWAGLEPQRGTYDAREMERLDSLITDLSDADIRILLGVNGMPSWAQNTSFAGNPGTAYPIRDGALDDFGRLGEFLAAHFGDRRP